MKSPVSDNSYESEDEIELEFTSSARVEELYDELVDRYNDIMTQIEMYEAVDDDIYELREKQMDKYDFHCLAEAYDALGEHTTAKGMRNQADECDERIEELKENLEDIDIKDHFMEMYELEIKKETYEIKMKACEKFLEKTRRRKNMEAKKSTIKAASPRRFPKPSSPSRLEPKKTEVKPETPREEPPEELLPPPPAPIRAPAKNTKKVEKVEEKLPLPLPPAPAPSLPKLNTLPLPPAPTKRR